MAGRKVFTAGEVLQAADVNDYLMDQSVMVFAGTAARGSAIPSPSEGMVTYRSDADTVEVYDGSSWNAVGPGQILQVVSTIKTDTFTSATSTFTNVTGASVTITPSSVSNKILLLGTLQLGFTPTAGQAGFVRIDGGNSSGYVGDAASNRVRAFGWTGVNDANYEPALASLHQSIAFLDSPATTSATTYTIQVRHGSGGTIYVGRSGTDTDSADYGRFPTTLIAMEVAG